MRRMRPNRSRLPRAAFSTAVPLFRVPEYTRKNVRLPTNGSLAILNASAANGASSAAGLVSSLFGSSGGLPFTGGTSNGEGRRSEEHTSELQSRENLVCRLLLEKQK